MDIKTHTDTIPELESYCGSWIIVSRTTGQPVLETFERSTAEAVNQDTYEVLTAHQWLARFNAEVRSVASALGRLGGLVKSEAKSTASRANGRKGGRPKSTKSIDMEDI